ncbi:MAG: hypothetical protein K2I66_05505, partial [Bacteroidales bacterium]|nr:hypothetical protein [Bacteroidales bacterium]
GLTTKTYEFRDGKVKPHIGDVSSFLADRQMERLQELERATDGAKAQAKAPAANPATTTPKPNAAQEREQQKQRERELRKLKNAIEKLENEIHELEAQLAEMDKAFIEDASLCTVENCNKYDDLKRTAARKTDEWAELQEKLYLYDDLKPLS